ncbi:MAG: cupin, partial [Ectothiorhodospiraceae bacterium]|nr:cupin [Ectothiorhodospiraceae bacterium]
MKVITKPTRIEAAGTPTKIIEEFFGRVNSSESAISIARMNSPKGW